MKNKTLVIALAGLAISVGASLFLFFKDQNLNNLFSGLYGKLNEDVARLSRRVPGFIYAGNAVGFVIEFENGKRFYIAGDTAPSADMKLVINDYYKPDVAFLPMGGFFTEGPQGMAFSASLVQPKDYVIPYHYASYPMLTKDASELSADLTKYNLANRLRILKVGEEQLIDGVKVVWLGHASLFLTTPGGKNILIDPATPLGLFPEKYKDLTAFGRVDLVLLTHGHPDHTVTGDLDKLTEMYKPVIIPQFELGNWLQENLKQPARVLAIVNEGATIAKQDLASVGFPSENIGDLKISMVSARHSSTVAPQP